MPRRAARAAPIACKRHANQPPRERRSGSLLAATGVVRVELAEVVPLTEVGRAHELSESGHTRGEIILAVGT